MSTKTLYAYTVPGREGPTAMMSMDVADAVALGRCILAEFDAEYAP